MPLCNLHSTHSSSLFPQISYFLASQFTFCYMCLLSVLPHFSLGTRSLLPLESRATEHQVQSKLIECLCWRSVARRRGDPEYQLQAKDEKKKKNIRQKQTKKFRRKVGTISIWILKTEDEKINWDICVVMRASGAKAIYRWHHHALENVSHSYPYHQPVFPLDWRVLPLASSTIISWYSVFCSVQPGHNDELI